MDEMIAGGVHTRPELSLESKKQYPARYQHNKTHQKYYTIFYLKKWQLDCTGSAGVYTLSHVF